ncbi:MAG TPA: excinuclease ABC subunit UvrA [Candidatus Omnitrophota bacterium]|nr:excinuclease ABC subunit UvrA [Candidatus Omnitrophota bacterium]HRZ15384.1 excinuclease ABC subunit UvrA [Candidatus Omnitrophota bacterium]
MEEYIFIKGARQHNLKNIDLKLPRNQFIVVTGLSGSGKSSLAFDTIYAEGQRRYVESLSSYARQFLEQLQKPDVEYIEGLSPAIAIEQRTAGGNPRSTVGTQTEIYDYLRLLFARIGTVSCFQCGQPIERQSSQEIVERILAMPQNTPVQILAPMISGRKGEYKDIFSQIQKAGFVRCRIDGVQYELPAPRVKLAKYQTHSIEVVVDRLAIKPEIKTRLTDSVETALKTGKGIVIVAAGNGKDMVFSEHYACSKCGISIPEVEPRLFSFNSPFGACPACNGLGIKLEFDPDLVIPDKTKSINEGAIEAWKRGGRGYILYYRWLIRELAHQMRFSLDAPFNKLGKQAQQAILFGSEEYAGGKPFEGVIPHLERLFRDSDSEYLKQEISRFMSSLDCPLCHGNRLKKEALAVTIAGKNIAQVCNLSMLESRHFFQSVKLNERQQIIAHQIFKEICQRLQFCIDVGLDYLTLDRKSSTLSGGEAQRVRLATQVGSGLVGVLYILDEPSIGLHQRDTARLINTLKALRDLGNTLIVVEHDESVIMSSDFVVDLGPGAGRHGGEIVYAGTREAMLKGSDCLTARYLRDELQIDVPAARRPWKDKPCLEILGAAEHNLKNIDVKFPLGVFIGVSGVSGSGKSTLINEIFYKGLVRELYSSREKAGKHKRISGMQLIDKVIMVDQDPIGRTPRSNPATYTGLYTPIRDLFSQLPEAKLRGFRPGRFSFNVKGGRCEACAGDGIKKIEMHFLPDVYVTCDVCKGKRFNEATLEVKYKGKSIADVLEMTVEEGLDLFSGIPGIRNTLLTLFDVGLGYIQLGQPATTLSGGEAQRIKLSSELSRRATGKTIYILDEPTTGLHFADVQKLISVLQRLVDKGNTVLVIEHNLEVIKSADYIVDLGPEGGDKGGEVVAAGSPEELTAVAASFTGQYLKKVLKTRR